MKNGQKNIKLINIIVALMCIVFLSMITSSLAWGDVTLTGETSKPSHSTYIKGDVVQLTFTVRGLSVGDTSQTLHLCIVDELEQVVQEQDIAIIADSSGVWSGTVSGPNTKYGFYRVYAELSNGTTIAKLVSRPVGYITYCIIPDPSTRRLSVSGNTFFGVFGGLAISDIESYLGIRWGIGTYDYGWRYVEPNYPGQLRDWLAEEGGASQTTSTWKRYWVAPLFLFPMGWNISPVVADTAIAYTGKLTPQGEIWWADYCRLIPQKYMRENPTLTEDLYQITWEPVRSWGFNGTDEDIIRIHEIAYPILHEVDSKAVVMGPTASHMVNDVGLIYSLFLKGIGKYIDAFSIHPYVMQGSTMPTDEIGFLRNILLVKEIIYATCGRDLPWYSTEQGYRTQEIKANEITQALGLIRSNLIMLGEGFRMGISFYIHDYLGEPGFGFYYNLNPNIDYGTDKIGPKPVVPAYAFLTWLLEGYKTAGSIEWLGDLGRGYAYERSGNIILAMWNYSETSPTVSIPVGVSQVKIYDWMGNRTIVSVPDGILQVTLSPQPIYIVGASANIWSSSAQKKLSLDDLRIRTSPGFMGVIRGKLTANSGNALTATLTLKTDSCLNLNAGKTITMLVPAGGQQKFEYQFKIPSDVPVGSYPVVLILSVNGVPQESVRCMVNVIYPATASPVFEPANGLITGPTTVTITCATTGAKIYYTTDGSMPSTCSSVYSEPVNVENGMILKAIAIGDDISEIRTQKYTEDQVTVVSQVASEDANPDQGFGGGRGTVAYSFMYPGSAEGYSRISNNNEWMYATITQWNLSSPQGSSITSVTSATVQFMVSGDYSPTGAYSGAYLFYRLTEAFDEESVTWNTKPAIDTSTCIIWTPDSTTTNGSLVTLDVSSLMAKNGNLSTFGIACIQAGGSMGSFLAQKEAGGGASPLLNATYYLVKKPGDANGDGLVDVGDLGILAANYGLTSGATWVTGDFNGDGAVDVGDLGILAANYGTGNSGTDFDADYLKIFKLDANRSDGSLEDNADSLCAGLGMPIIASFLLGCMMWFRSEKNN